MAIQEDQGVANHLDRLRAGLSGARSLDKVPEWIEQNTYLKGEKFSFKDHEYQLSILRDKTPNKIVRKCSQIGISEMSTRMALAQVNLVPGFTVIYTLPTAAFASTFAKTRVDLVVLESSKLRDNINSDNNNTEVKQFGTGFLYMKGTRGTAAAISVPADHLIHDELDFSDLTVVSNYESRLTHSKYKFRTKFSTPTVDKYGISAAFSESRRMFNFCKCNHCNHHFIPSYFTDVVVPGWDDDIKKITRDNLDTLNYREAYVKCPKCGLQPDLGPDHREYVCENPHGDPDTVGYQISPFDAPRIITAGSLIRASTVYARYTDFINFNLGLPAEDKESSVSAEDLEEMFIPAADSGYLRYVMGIDVGQTCHMMVAGLSASGGIHVVHAQTVPHYQLERTKNDLAMRYNVRFTLMDSQPYFDTLVRMQNADPNMWGALYTRSREFDIYKIKVRDEDKDQGQMYVRQVDINRNRAFDSLLEAIRGKEIHILENEQKPTIAAHLQDMKRIRALGEDGDFSYQWRKSEKGNDHYHHTLLYTLLAARMCGLSGSSIMIPSFTFSMRLKQTP